MAVYEALMIALTFGLFIVGLIGLVVVIVRNLKKITGPMFHTQG